MNTRHSYKDLISILPNIKYLELTSNDNNNGKESEKINNNSNYFYTLLGENKKLKEIFQTLLKLDSELFSKLRKVLTKCYFDYLINIKDGIANLVYKSSGSTSILLDK